MFVDFIVLHSAQKDSNWGIVLKTIEELFELLENCDNNSLSLAMN